MADPDFVFMDGFDKYGPVNTNGEQFIRALNNSGEWSGFQANSSWDVNYKAAAPLGSSTGCSLQIYDSDSSLLSLNVYKTVPGNYPRTIGGVYFKSSALNYIYQVVNFSDVNGNATQLYIAVDTAGKLGVWRGNFAGTRIATSTYTYVAGTSIGIEWDITFSSTTGIVKVWIDGVLDINLTGQNTISTANSYFNRIYLGVIAASITGISATLNYDHFYLWCYNAAGGTETPIGGGFQVQTSFPIADSTPSQFNGRRYLGNYSLLTATGMSSATDITMTGPFTVPNNCQALGIVWWPNINSTGTYTTYVGIYAESGGSPTTLLAQSVTSTTAANDPTGLYFDTPLSLTAGSKFFLAHTINVGSSTAIRSGLGIAPSYRVSRATFAPLPATAPALGTSTFSSQQAIGIIASGFTGGKFDAVDMNPALPSFVYNYDSVAGDVDAYTFGGLEGSPTAIYYLALKGVLGRTNTGSRTARLEVDSAGTISAGSLGSFTPAVVGSNQNGGPIYATYFKNDPATSTAWTNSAAAGIKGRAKVVS